MRSLYVYSFIFCGTCFFFLLAFLFYPSVDHIGAVSLHHDKTWYMNFRRSTSTYALDRDIFYHNIGNSIKNAKNADIIILGHSMALFGIDWRQIEQFCKDHHVRIFNMSSGGDTSGEFVLRIVEKYHIKPAIWIINADDHERSFFSSYLVDAKGESGDIVSYNRWQAYKNTISKNIKWKTELLVKKIAPLKITQIFYPVEPIFNYRSTLHGNWNNDNWPAYKATNPSFINAHEADCHATNAEINQADQYIHRLKNGNVILTLVPHTNSCRPRVKEIAEHLHAPFISIDWKNMTSFDQGGHLDDNGAKKFTAQLLQQLEKTSAFKNLVKKKNPGTLPQPG